MDININGIDINKLDFREIGAWPYNIRIIAFIIIGIAAIILGYFGLVNNNVLEFKEQHDKQISLRNEFRDKFHKSTNLEEYQKQMEEVKGTLNKLIKQLPTDENLPSLMEEISVQATAAGLEFNSIKPGNTIEKEFYTELPISMSLTGTYHELGKFISSVAKLPRIVTLHDFEIKANQRSNKSKTSSINGEKELTLNIEAKTYWCPSGEKS